MEELNERWFMRLDGAVARVRISALAALRRAGTPRRARCDSNLRSDLRTVTRVDAVQVSTAATALSALHTLRRHAYVCVTTLRFATKKHHAAGAAPCGRAR